MWDKLIQGFVLALIWLYRTLGASDWSFVLSIAVLTAVVRLITVPLTVPSQRAMKRNSAKMQALQPEMDKLKKKFRNDPQKLQQAQMQLYQEHGINPLSGMVGCLPLLIQLPLIWAFYQSISRALASQPGEMLVLAKYLYAVPGFMPLIPLPGRWLWLDLARPDHLAILPVLVGATTWLQQKLFMPTTQTSDPQAAQMNQSMMFTMPLFMGIIAMQAPSGLSIYFIVSNVVGMIVQWITNRLLNGSGQATPRKAASAPPRSTERREERRRGRPVTRKRGYKRRQ